MYCACTTDNCTTCIARQRKCHNARPVYHYCTGTGVGSGGCPASGKDIQKPLFSPPTSRIGNVDLTSISVPVGYYPERSIVENIPTSSPSTPLEWANATVSKPLSSQDYGHLGLDSALTTNYNLRQFVHPNVIPRQAPTAPYRSTITGCSDKVSPTSVYSKRDIRKSMTPGQASLFDALLSLARPGDKIFGGVSGMHVRHGTPLGPAPPSPSFEDHLFRIPSPPVKHMVSRVQMIWRIWIQDSAAHWCWIRMSRATHYHLSYKAPARIIPEAKMYILSEYSIGPESRWRMFKLSNIVVSAVGSTECTLQDFETLESHMHSTVTTVISKFGNNREADRTKALLSIGNTYELVKVIQLVAPIFRRACPDSQDRPANLPALLTQTNINVRYYAMLDVLLGAVINRPMNFRYETAIMPGIDIENSPGMRWVYGIPDRLAIILARMNGLLEDFGSNVDHRIIKELEAGISSVETVVSAPDDSNLDFGRLVVQECWRQVAYIYLYMLSGAGFYPSSHVSKQLGIATRHPHDQELLRRRMLALPECSRRGTTGNQFIRMLEAIWGSINESGQPTTWSNLRLASLYIAGV
ncbi:hypothetical protein AG1IA_05130 [Rhizoctonia solani AG-1 IA]|uniref:Fungal zn(2)-Cys(6) binuclear cluster domain-containing protein n=1 Tax=Thanatephorus cucumeris (strain AG1-IA) TaxID=983506 RepID=L8WVL5_THACA|nr:hypothetical protein AG1IA_05130 [Rhizoctonia solani AG-1 IA]